MKCYANRVSTKLLNIPATAQVAVNTDGTGYRLLPDQSDGQTDAAQDYKVVTNLNVTGGNAPTAEKLMRSRFSAFARKDTAYLLRTWYPSTRPAALQLEDAQTWTRLEILGHTGGGMLDTEGRVEFIAHGTERGAPHSMREHSTFVKEHGAWLYVAALPR